MLPKVVCSNFKLLATTNYFSRVTKLETLLHTHGLPGIPAIHRAGYDAFIRVV